MEAEDRRDRGSVKKISIVSEEPPFLGFGDTAFEDLGKAKFIPAFRDGKPVACDVKMPVYFNTMRASNVAAQSPAKAVRDKRPNHSRNFFVVIR